MIKLASWNVNSLKIRLSQVLDWMQAAQIDILALQETKLQDAQFPVESFTERGYQVVYAGQPSYNGVALISKYPIKDLVLDIPNLEDPSRRILAASVADLRVINLYVPNGSHLTSEKYTYKLDWLQKVTDFIRQQLALYPKLAVVGDFNIAPEDRDVFDPNIWRDCVLVSAPEREAFSKLLALGLVDSFRQFAQEENFFSWWDYREAAFRRNRGLRIDHILLSDVLKGLCSASCIDKAVRKLERPSDHAPVWVSLDLGVYPK